MVHSEAMSWMEDPNNFEKIEGSFNSTSSYARLQNVRVRISGRYLYVRFTATTGDAMGMNMVSKVGKKSRDGDLKCRYLSNAYDFNRD